MATNTNMSVADKSLIDAFGRFRVSNAQTAFDSQQSTIFDTQKVWDAVVYDSATEAVAPPSMGGFVTGSNGSSIGVSPSGVEINSRLVPIILKNTYASSRCIIQSKEYVQYVPSKSHLIRKTGIFAPQTPKVSQEVELVLRTTVSGTTSDDTYSALQANWNQDVFDGSGSKSNPSGILLDFSKIQIFTIDAQMLYAGTVRVGFSINGANYYAHKFHVANISSLPSVQSFNLPLRHEMSNESGLAVTRAGYFDSKNGVFLKVSDVFVSGEAKSFMKCCAVLSEGGKDLGFYPSRVARYGSIGLTTTPIPLITIRPKLLFNGFENRVRIFPTQISAINSGNEAVEFFIVHDAGLVGASVWDSTDTTKTYEYNTNATGFTGGDDATGFSGGHIVSASAAPSGSGNVDTIGFIGAIKFRTPIVLSKVDDLVISQETLTIGARTTSGTSACDMVVLNVEELTV